MLPYWTFLAMCLTNVAANPIEDNNQITDSTTQVNSTCYYKGVEYIEGDTILLEEPCLACTCQRSSLVCSLRVCPKLPDPPPSGCVVLHKRNQCCPQIICEDVTGLVAPKPNLNVTTKSGCAINGGIYSDGSALPSSTLCEFCYCMQGQQRCISPHCSKPAENCIPTFSQYSCCPVHYNCSTDESYRKLSAGEGCDVNGTHYLEGDLVETSTLNTCKTCYCINSEVNCQPERCTIQHMEGCYPVYAHDRCCPVAYNCSESNNKYTGSIDRSLEVEDTLQDSPTDTPELTTATELPETTTTSITTTESYWNSTEETNEPTEYTTEFSETTTISENDAAFRIIDETTTPIMENTTPYATTLEPEEVITASVKVLNLTIASNLRMDNSNGTPNFIDDGTIAQPLGLDDFILNSTQSDDDYESYDYSEPKLPPSLPNLVIFPFVAADAVTKEKEKDVQAMKKNDQVPNPAYYSPFFNPPVETEGGFVPKNDITPDSATYQPIFFDDKVPIIAESIDEDHPSITMPPTTKSEICVSDGIEYQHGAELPPLIECISCVCMYGDIMCEETPCPQPPPGCVRSLETPKKSCCGSITCETYDATLPPIDITTSPSNDTNIVLEPIVTTDNPFRDVIRTEPAPDLPSLMGEILPYLMDQQTKKPVTVNYKNKIVNYYPKHQITTTNDQQKTTLTVEEHSAVVSSTTPYDANTLSETSASPVYRPTTPTKNVPTSTQYLTNTILSSSEVQQTTSEVASQHETTTAAVVEDTIDNIAASIRDVSTPMPDVEQKRTTLLGVKPKPSKTTTTEESFFGEFLKGFFDGADEKNSTTQPSKMHHIYSSKIREPLIIPTTTMASVEIIQNKEGEETETGSFSLDKVLDMLFQAEATEAPVKTTKPKNSTKVTRKPQRKTKKPTTVTQPTTTTTSTTTETTVTVLMKSTTERNKTVSKDHVMSATKTTNVPESSFVTDNYTGFPKINILQQVEKKSKAPFKAQDEAKGHVSKQTETSRKPTKVSGGMGGMLKLAGCNIYGRMYRVGKIIAELTNACMECMCTESGVQCSKIKC